MADGENEVYIQGEEQEDPIITATNAGASLHWYSILRITTLKRNYLILTKKIQYLDSQIKWLQMKTMLSIPPEGISIERGIKMFVVAKPWMNLKRHLWNTANLKQQIKTQNRFSEKGFSTFRILIRRNFRHNNRITCIRCSNGSWSKVARSVTCCVWVALFCVNAMIVPDISVNKPYMIDELVSLLDALYINWICKDIYDCNY